MKNIGWVGVFKSFHILTPSAKILPYGEILNFSGRFSTSLSKHKISDPKKIQEDRVLENMKNILREWCRKPIDELIDVNG